MAQVGCFAVFHLSLVTSESLKTLILLAKVGVSRHLLDSYPYHVETLRQSLTAESQCWWSLTQCPALVKVDMAGEEEAFAGVVSSSLNVLLLALETRLDAPLAAMTRLPWATLEVVRFCTTLPHAISTPASWSYA